MIYILNALIYLRPGADLGLKHGGGYTTTDLFTGENLGSVLPDHQMDLMVNPNGELVGLSRIRTSLGCVSSLILSARTNSRNLSIMSVCCLKFSFYVMYIVSRI